MLGYYPQLGDGARAEAGRAVQPGLHPTRILDLYTQSLTPTGRGYELISSGTCASEGLVTITTTTWCMEAVKALGRTVSKVYPTNAPKAPWGCYYHPSNKATFMNSNAANSASRKASAKYQSVCSGETNV